MASYDKREREIEELCVLEEGGREWIPKGKGVIPPKIKNNFYLKSFFFFFFFFTLLSQRIKMRLAGVGCVVGDQ